MAEQPSPDLTTPEPETGVDRDTAEEASAAAEQDAPTGPLVADAPADETRAGPPPEKKRKKKKKKEKGRRRDPDQPIDPWDRYRSLRHVLNEAIDLVEIADRKVRFALVIMVALNMGLLFVVARTDLLHGSPTGFRPWVALYQLVYAAIALYFFLQAIAALRPRTRRSTGLGRGSGVASRGSLPGGSLPGGSLPGSRGLRFYEGILHHGEDDYYRAWNAVRIEELNRELASQAYTLASINEAKLRALSRLYFGLEVMILMAVGLLAFAVAPGSADTPIVAPDPSSRPGAAAGFTMSEPTRLPARGVGEPSGIAFHPPSGHLFVVGDEGRLAEVDRHGKRVVSSRVEGDLEGITVHSPSGDLVVLLEDQAALVVVDPATHQVRRRFELDAVSLLGVPRVGPGDGFEGLAFRADSALPGGGAFYLAHQRDPAMIVELSFDPDRDDGVLTGDRVSDRWQIPGRDDLSAIAYEPASGRFLVVADSADLLLVLDDEGNLERELPLPGEQQEGVCLDDSGALWIADDEEDELLRVDGFVAASADEGQQRPAAEAFP